GDRGKSGREYGVDIGEHVSPALLDQHAGPEGLDVVGGQHQLTGLEEHADVRFVEVGLVAQRLLMVGTGFWNENAELGGHVELGVRKVHFAQLGAKALELQDRRVY